MNEFIIKKLEDLKLKHDLEEEQKKIKIENDKIAHEEFIQSKLPEAHDWIKNHLYNQIAEIEFNIQKHKYTSASLYRRIYIKDYFSPSEYGSNVIPTESILLALKEANIEGIKVITERVPGARVNYSDDYNEWIPAHDQYCVTWDQIKI